MLSISFHFVHFDLIASYYLSFAHLPIYANPPADRREDTTSLLRNETDHYGIAYEWEMNGLNIIIHKFIMFKKTEPEDSEEIEKGPKTHKRSGTKLRIINDERIRIECV